MVILLVMFRYTSIFDLSHVSSLSRNCLHKVCWRGSTHGIFRRINEFGFSVRAIYSTCSDEELDHLVTEIKKDMPHAGFRLVKGSLQARGFRVQWEKVRASMHHVDTFGILCRMNHLGCVVRCTYSVPGTKALVHMDTNHKLIRSV